MDRRDTLAGRRESEFGVIDVPLDANESTFFLQPPAPSSPGRVPSDIEEDPAISENDRGAGDAFDVDDGAPSELEEEQDVETTHTTTAAHKKRRSKRGLKLSRHNIEYPSLPVGVVKHLAQTIAQTSGVGKAKLSPDTLQAIMRASDWFFEQLGNDLQAYAQHAKRKVIDESDMLMLMRRYVTALFWVSPLRMALTVYETTTDQCVRHAILSCTAASPARVAARTPHAAAAAAGNQGPPEAEAI